MRNWSLLPVWPPSTIRRPGQSVPSQSIDLSWFTPLPPARNGIADYSGMLLGEISKIMPCICYTETPLAEVSSGIELRDPQQAFRHLSASSPILHQIGNNRDHVFVLDALRCFGGVTSLHDLSLLYVNELGAANRASIYGQMQQPAGKLGSTYARHWKQAGLKTAANYVLFDMVGQVLSRSLNVIVHSQYARNKLVAVHGREYEAKIAVIPHFAKKVAMTSSREARQQLGIDPDETLILTSGFAAKAKRFDWLVEALGSMRAQGHRFRWIHAGEERPSEYALAAAVNAHPELAECFELTGYLSDDKLDGYIVASDIVVNLRFPSVGESSGTLARAFSAGRCCLVSDTAAYAEIPHDVVVHVPVFDSVAALVRALVPLLDDRALRESFGDRARQYARRFLTIAAVAKSYVEVIASSYVQRALHPIDRSQSHKLQSSAPIRLDFDIADGMPDLTTSLAPTGKSFELTLWFSSPEHFADVTMEQSAWIDNIVGPHVEIESAKFIYDERPIARQTGRLGLSIAGRACGS
jgi:glycosyltransferase involved in cell wall biosynthesis